MLIDSHCHLDRIDLADFDSSFDKLMQEAQAAQVSQFLSVCVDPREFPALCKIADSYSNVSISVGLHPNDEVDEEPNCESLTKLAQSHPACIAIGETGLDYYRVDDVKQQALQRNRFREHIWASQKTSKPLIIHTRQAAEDTLRVMFEEDAGRIGGVMHCFSEDWSIAKRAMEMNFYISLSGIVTFKNATNLQELAKKIPIDRLLIETDAPYLAPVPFRGKQNHPALVKYVALALAELKGLAYEELAYHTSQNFKRCFGV